MKKTIPATLILCALLSFLVAVPVPQSEADIVAANWCRHWSGLHSSALSVSSYEVIGTQLYLYHLNPAGFLLISADDNVKPVLAYDFSSTTAVMPPSVNDWLRMYQSECDYVRSNGITNPRNNLLWSELLTNDLHRYQNTRDVSPMIWSMWGEADEWNASCPEDAAGPGGNARAGSHSVAMAMLMKYWNHPAQGEGDNSYEHPVYGTISAVFDTTHYGWTHMPNTFSTSWTENMIFHCGVATSMDYGPTFSSTTIDSVATAMIEHFRYSSEIDLLTKSNYDNAVWEEMVRTELENGRPLFYRGDGTSVHAHLLDGYQNTDFFHFNWGVEGNFNGYFQLSSITPANSNFTSNQQALFNVQPGLGPDTIDESFENDWNTFNWEFAGQSDWQIATDEHFYGIKSAKSGDINHNQTSEIFHSWNVFDAGQVTFYRKVSCEDDGNDGFDRLEFWIDGVEVGRWGGEREWEQMTFDVTAGIHEFRWIYRKDGSLVAGQDCAWVDAIDFPGGATPLNPPQNFTATIVNDDSVFMTWEMPLVRNLLGYRIFRNDVEITTILNPNTLQFIDPDLPNGSYSYYARAVYTSGVSDPTVIYDLNIEVLYPPTDLLATVSDFDDVLLVWNLPATQQLRRNRLDVTRSLLGYRIYRDATLIDSVYNPTTLQYADDDMPTGTYAYHVSAIYSTGYSELSNVAVAAIGVPWPPSGLTAQVQNLDDVFLDWTAPPQTSETLTGYKIYRESSLVHEVTDTTSTSWTETDLPNGTHSYNVTAIYGAVESEPSNTAQAIIEVPYPPQNLTAEVNEDDVTLDWDAPATGTRNLTAYFVYRNGNPVATIWNTSVTSYFDPMLANGFYTYEVMALYGNVFSAPSNAVSIEMDIPYPPANLTAQVQNLNDVVLDWDQPAVQGGITRAFIGYRVIRNGDSYALITDFDQLTWTDVNVDNGDYDYYVYAEYNAGNSTPTNTVNVTIEVLYPPRNPAYSITDDDIVLTWDLPFTGGGLTRDLLGYKIYRNGAEAQIIGDPAVLTWTDTGLANGTYAYYLTATYSSGDSAPSDTLEVMLEVLYPASNLVGTVIGGDDVSLTWSPAANSGGLRLLQGYRVFRNDIDIADVTPADTTWLDSTLPNGDYNYYVKAVYETGLSAETNHVPIHIEVLYPVRQLSATVDIDDVTLDWLAPLNSGGLTRDLIGYRIYRDNVEIAVIGDPAQLAYSDMDLDNGYYSYTVKAEYALGLSEPSDAVFAVVEVLYPPTGLAAVVAGDTVSLSWSVPADGPTRNLLGYTIFRDGSVLQQIIDPATVNYSDVDLANGIYSYEIVADYASGQSVPDGPVTAAVEELYPPRNLSHTLVDYHDVILTWNTPVNQGGLTRDLIGYRVYRDTVHLVDVADTTYTDLAVPDGLYEYTVKAVYSSGVSEASNTTSVLVEYPYPPSDLTATVCQDSVLLDWVAPNSNTCLGYKVYRNGIEIADIGDPSTLAYLDADLANGGYDYEVSALYTTGESQMSNLVSVTVEVLYPPIGLAATVDQDEVTLAWQLPSTQGGLTRDLLGYKVYRNGIEIADIGDPSTLAYLDADLANGGYDYEVSALYTTGESQMSNL
ncbi:MAG: C10 family peptidase, partial [Candidatus Cloacimonetes bacterium]|nr:C10 family peptidase [Candidatus Cloacimonadota bacterium]